MGEWHDFVNGLKTLLGDDGSAKPSTITNDKPSSGKPSQNPVDVLSNLWGDVTAGSLSNPFGGGGGGQPAAATGPGIAGPDYAGVNKTGGPTTVPTTTGQQPLIDPLSTQLFFQSAIAPMLQNLATNLGNQNSEFTKLAQSNLDKRQMPESYKAIFGQAIPRMAADQNDVIAALTGAAASAPALDQLMAAINTARAASTKDYNAVIAGMTQAAATPNASGGTTPTIGAFPVVSQLPQQTDPNSTVSDVNLKDNIVPVVWH